jgi:hypothetical protein
MNLLMMSSSKLKYRYPNPAILTPSSIGPSCTTTTTTTTTHNGGKNLTNPSLPCIVLGRQSAGEARNGVDSELLRQPTVQKKWQGKGIPKLQLEMPPWLPAHLSPWMAPPQLHTKINRPASGERSQKIVYVHVTTSTAPVKPTVLEKRANLEKVPKLEGTKKASTTTNRVQSASLKLPLLYFSFLGTFWSFFGFLRFQSVLFVRA